MEKKIDQYKPSPYFIWSIHLDGDQEMHDKSVCEPGVYDRAVAAQKTAKANGFRVTINCTFFNDADPERIAAFFDTVTSLASTALRFHPATPMSARRTSSTSSTARRPRNCSAVFRRGDGARKWSFNQSSLSSTSSPGNQAYHCTPWGNPTRTVFGWQRPCYLLGEGYAKTFKELMEETDWDGYGTGNYEKCADCMVHSGFEATAVMDTIAHPLKALAGQYARRADRWPDGTGNPARPAAAGEIRL